METTCSGWRRTACRRWGTGSGPAAIARTTRASGTSRTRISTPTTATVPCSRSTTTASESTRAIQRYLDADLLDDYGFSEWVGPDPHGLGKHNTGLLKDPFTADETIALLERLDTDGGDAPWLTVCSFLNPHDDSMFGVVALTQGLRYHPSLVPHVDQAPTR